MSASIPFDRRCAAAHSLVPSTIGWPSAARILVPGRLPATIRTNEGSTSKDVAYRVQAGGDHTTRGSARACP
jgi:hypothetical protein